jgi:N-dimethylarginine dimethylaminohydrolase
MGDPSHFSVKGGANPHTRTRWGTRRRVDRRRAIAQWRCLKDTLEDLGLRVLVVPPEPTQPGLAYPANAGVVLDVDTPRPPRERHFYLSNLLPTRAGEKPHYRRVLDQVGIRTFEIDAALRFEGEADLFPAGDRYILTHGRLEKQRFAPRWALPPWKRIYGFRTDARVRDALIPLVAPKEILRVELVLEAHYHGDTALCAFGRRREHLLVYPEALAAPDRARVRESFGAASIELGEADARHYAANSFTYTPPGQSSESFLVMPGGVSERLLGQVRERGVTPLAADVSEFLKKGGGSVKCMIGDLGPVLDTGSSRTRVESRASGPPR